MESIGSYLYGDKFCVSTGCFNEIMHSGRNVTRYIWSSSWLKTFENIKMYCIILVLMI